MTSEQLSGVPTPGEVARVRLKERRKQRGLNPDRAAELYADPAMTATVLMNIEAGRRRTSLTVDELVRFAYALDVPVETLLTPEQGQHVQVAPDVTVDAETFLRWARGEQPLPGTDTALYEASAEQLPSGGGHAMSLDLRDVVLARAQAAFDGFMADTDEIQRKTRDQVREVLAEVRGAVVAGRPADDVLSLIDDFLTRLR